MLVASIVVKAGIIVILGYIALSDFNTQKIRNQHLIYLLVGTLALCSVRLWQGEPAWTILEEGAAAGGLFLVLIIFWLIGKLGAGDVKLLVIVPLIVGLDGSMTFAVGLLVFTTIIYVLTKFPVLVPQRWFHTYLVGLGKTGRIPFGVPISMAAVVALLVPIAIGSFPSAVRTEQMTTLDFNALHNSP